MSEIHVYDDDFLTHNAFRAPGAPSLDDLNERPRKVDYFTDIYSQMHRGIVPHPHSITEENVAELGQMTFVFISIDDAPAKAPVIETLLAAGIPFIDVGMGVELVDNHLTGIVRTTKVTPEKNDHAATRISTVEPDHDGDYRTNIQIAELNARNATDAVILWKKYRGVYADLGTEHSTALSISTNHVINGDHVSLPYAEDDECE